MDRLNTYPRWDGGLTVDGGGDAWVSSSLTVDLMEVL